MSAQVVRSVELVSGRRYLMETTYVPVWDGRRDGPGGPLLGEYGPPRPVQPREWLVLDDPDAAVRARPNRCQARVVRPRRPVRHAGPVFYARPAIWALLAAPVTIDDIATAVGVPRHGLKSAVGLLLEVGAVVRAGLRPNLNLTRRPGERRTSVLYQRAPAYQSSETWPTLLPRRRRAQAIADIQRRQAERRGA